MSAAASCATDGGATTKTSDELAKRVDGGWGQGRRCRCVVCTDNIWLGGTRRVNVAGGSVRARFHRWGTGDFGSYRSCAISAEQCRVRVFRRARRHGCRRVLVCWGPVCTRYQACTRPQPRDRKLAANRLLSDHCVKYTDDAGRLCSLLLLFSDVLLHAVARRLRWQQTDRDAHGRRQDSRLSGEEGNVPSADRRSHVL